MRLLPRIAACFSLAIVALGLSPDASAQRPGRSILSNDEAWPVGVDTVTSWGAHSDGTLSAVDLRRMAAASAQSDVHVIGGMFVMSELQVLVCGRDNLGRGCLEHWRFDPATGGMQMQSAYQTTSMDFAGVVYHTVSQRISLLDCTGHRIVGGSWDGSDPLGNLSLTTLVTSSTVPFLLEAAALILVPSRNGVNGTMNLVRWPLRRGSALAEIVDATPPSIKYAIDDWSAKRVSLSELTVTEGATSVEAWGPPGSTVEVLSHDSSTVLGSAVVGPAGVATVSLSEQLVIGSLYTARTTDGATGVPTSCVCRHASGEAFSTGAALDGFYYQSGARIGQPFVVEVGVTAGLPSNPTGYEGMLLIGIRMGNTDPLIPYGNNVLLSTSTYVPARGFVTTSGWGMVFGEVVIPNDPGLVGLVFLTQFVMEDGPDYVLSQVYGSVIEAVPQQGASAQATTSPNHFAPAVATQHLQSGLLTGAVRDATPRLLHVLSRR
jgi:hypothetical protein